MSRKASGAQVPAVRVRVPATSGNLGPGFDCLGLALALHNDFEGWRADRNAFRGRGAEGTGLAGESGRDNLVHQAIRTGFRHRGQKAPPFAVDVTCRIPLARGLGSSATAIVAGLMIAARHVEPRLDAQEILALASEMEGHPDNVAPAILGGLTVATLGGDGQVLVGKLRLPDSVRIHAVVPDMRLSTEEARGVLPTTYSREQAVHNVSRVALLAARIAAGDVSDLWEALDDRLHQPFRAHLVPGFEAILKAAREAGASGGFLSGAGPTVLVLSEGELPELEERLLLALRSAGVDGRVLPLSVETGGARYLRPRQRVNSSTTTRPSST